MPTPPAMSTAPVVVEVELAVDATNNVSEVTEVAVTELENTIHALPVH